MSTSMVFRFRRALLGLRDERGDVPGWVLVTIMTAGIVAVLWQFAEPYLRDILQQALEAVSP
ncbi:MAG TPA: hypothetical protein VFH02_11435 [Jiangellaceae bacterium]|jgi:hypothetical protein|nr:hypothetical protein [Jiangellaceae bacterium]